MFPGVCFGRKICVREAKVFLTPDKNIFCFPSSKICFRKTCFPARLNWETFASATMFPLRCFLVQPGLQIQGRERLRVRDFLMEQQRARVNQRHFGGKNLITSSFLYEVLQKCCGVKTSQENSSSFGIFQSEKRLSYKQ